MRSLSRALGVVSTVSSGVTISLGRWYLSLALAALAAVLFTLGAVSARRAV